MIEGLPSLLARRWLLVGVGNELRGDDGFGPRLARRLAAEGLPAIDAGTAPENVTGPIRRARPEVLILADVADLGDPVGTVRLLDPDLLLPSGPSTHDPGLALLARFVRAELGAEVRLLAAQPGPRAFGAERSPEITAAVERLAAEFRAARSRPGSPPPPPRR